MTGADVGFALTVLLIVLGFTLYVRFIPYRHETRKIDRYRLFAVRDKLITLVADGKIEESDEVFEYLYESVNLAIPTARPMSLPTFVAAMKQNVNPDRLSFIRNVLSHKEESVRVIAGEFFNVLGDIIISRSTSVRAYLVIVKIGIIGYEIERLLGKVFRTQNEVYQLYRKTTTVAQEIRCAA